MRLFRDQTTLQSLLLTAAACLMLSPPMCAEEAAKNTSPHYIPAEQDIAFQPVRAQIILSLQTRDEHDAAWQAELRQHLRNHWGNRVRFDLSTSEPANRLTSIPVDLDSAAQLADTEIELTLTEKQSQLIVRSRRWLRLTDDWISGPRFEIHNPKLVPRYLARAAADLLQPIVHVQRVDADTCAGTVVAGERLSPEVPSGGDLELEQVLQPMLLYSNREGDLVKRQSLPWTYLEVTHLRRAQMTAETISAFRAPLPAARRRVDIYATRVVTHEPETIIAVSRRSEPPRNFPLAELLVSPWHRSPQAETDTGTKDANEDLPETLRLTCDRKGHVRINSEEVRTALGTSLVKIEVLSGDSVVARVPWVIGSTDKLELMVPDDTARLTALEGLDQIETDLLRVAAKRATLLAALRKLADQASDADASPLWTELLDLPGRDQFQRRISLVRVTSTDALQKLNNKTAARQVEKACEQTSLLVEKHLSNENLEDLKQQLNLETFLKEQAVSTPDES
ncbi:hypothetical protein [Rubinisphaera sp. JC750]|uniref:hypothetical protein n=1 Tax=Rubinisphaera sp. JC750 TaxID=2898658 RepID=UPI001F27D32D|nr:hypothetical protein [Rubinisphaera sp. JC750]